jgi:hypothetical protein
MKEVPVMGTSPELVDLIADGLSALFD